MTTSQPFQLRDSREGAWLKKYLDDIWQCHQRLQRLQKLSGAPGSPKGRVPWVPNPGTGERSRPRWRGGGASPGSACRAPNRGCGKASRLAQLSRFPVPPASARGAWPLSRTASLRRILQQAHAVPCFQLLLGLNPSQAVPRGTEH